MGQRKHPSPEMLNDLDKVYKKHNWSGAAIGLRELDDEADGDACPPGTVAKEVTYQLPDGTWVTKTVCVKG